MSWDQIYLLTHQSYIVPLDQIPFLDHPELRIDEHESTEMPFRYVKGSDGEPVMPKVSMWGVYTSYCC